MRQISLRCRFSSVSLLPECIAQNVAEVTLNVIPDHQVGADPGHPDRGGPVRSRGLSLRENARSDSAADQLKKLRRIFEE